MNHSCVWLLLASLLASVKASSQIIIATSVPFSIVHYRQAVWVKYPSWFTCGTHDVNILAPCSICILTWIYTPAALLLPWLNAKETQAFLLVNFVIIFFQASKDWFFFFQPNCSLCQDAKYCVLRKWPQEFFHGHSYYKALLKSASGILFCLLLVNMRCILANRLMWDIFNRHVCPLST